MKRNILGAAVMLLIIMFVACTNSTDKTHGDETWGETDTEVGIKDLVGTWTMSVNDTHYTVLIKEDGTGVATKRLYDRVERADISLQKTEDGDIVTKSDHAFADGWRNYLTTNLRYMVIEYGQELYALKREK